jgi:hypothetical protein
MSKKGLVLLQARRHELTDQKVRIAVHYQAGKKVCLAVDQPIGV